MNQAAIDQFKGDIHRLMDELSMFLRWVEDMESQEKVYDQKMIYVSKQNKDTQDYNDRIQKKEQELILQEKGIEANRVENQKKKEELLLRETAVLKEKEKLAQEYHMVDKERKMLVIDKVAKEKFDVQVAEVEKREKLMDMNEKIYADKKEKLEYMQKQVEAKGKRLQSMIA